MVVGMSRRLVCDRSRSFITFRGQSFATSFQTLECKLIMAQVLLKDLLTLLFSMFIKSRKYVICRKPRSLFGLLQFH